MTATLQDPSLLHQLCRQLPKVDLHRHLEGSLRFETVRELARSQGMPLANFFWSRNFFGDVPYDAKSKSLTPEEAFAELNRRAVANILNGGLTALGEAAKRLLAR